MTFTKQDTNKPRALYWIGIILFWFYMMPIQAQENNYLTVSIVALPPISSTYSEYEDLSNKVVVTVTNISGEYLDNVVLHGSIIMTDDLFIATRYDYAPPYLMRLTFMPGETKTIVSDPMQLRFLQRNVLEPSAFAQEIITSNKLPEGNLNLCVEAVWFMDNVPMPISNSACFPLNITRAAPPVITSPFNEQVIPEAQSHIAFTWTPPAGNTIGAQLTYDLYVVKLLPGQSPNEAIDAAVNYKANNPFVKTNIMSHQYITQPYDLEFDKGFTYAVQVVARDINKKVALQNDGRSEVVTFQYGDEKQGGVTLNEILKVKRPVIGEFPIDVQAPVPRSQVKGKLYARFKYEIPKTPEEQYDDGPATNDNGKFDMGLSINQALSSGMPITAGGLSGQDLTYNQDQIATRDAQPLAGKKVSLVVTYIFSGSAKNKYGGEENVNSQPVAKGDWKMNLLPQEIRNTADKVLATTTTGNDGSFIFDFTNVEKELGLIDEEVNLLQGPTEFSESMSGKLFKVLRIKIDDKYYCSPEVNIKVDPYKGVDVGNLVSFIKSYNLMVRVGWTDGDFWDIDKKDIPLSKVATAIGRKSKPAGVPESEKKSVNLSKFAKQSSLDILDENKTDTRGLVTFYNLVQHDPDRRTDHYFITCFYDEKGAYSFDTAEKSYYPKGNKDKETFPFNDVGSYMPAATHPTDIVLPVNFGESIIWNSQLEVKTYFMEMPLYPAKPVLSGKATDATNPGADAFKGINVVMLNDFTRPASLTELMTVVKTDNEGRYRFNNLSVEWDGLKPGETTKIIGPKRKIFAKPNGYKTGFWPAPPGSVELKWGQQINNADLELYPDGWLQGYVEDENGNAVESYIDIAELVKVKTQSQLFPSDGQDGYSMVPKMELKQVFSTAAPSGNKTKIKIEPVDPTYSATDTIINIAKGDGTNAPVMKFVVHKAQKRIRFQVLEEPTSEKTKKPGSSNPIPGALVKLDLPGVEFAQETDEQGYVQFVFENMSKHFTFIITPPPGTDYEEGTHTIPHVENSVKTVLYDPAYLRKSATIAGTVTAGNDSQPLKDASVYIEMGSGQRIETKTDNFGKYILKGVPTTPKEQKVWASKPGAIPNIISQSKIITIKESNTLDFQLEEDPGLLIESIYGFEVDIKTKEKQGDDTWIISGSLINLPGNDNFALANANQTIPFADLVMKKSTETRNGIPLGVPVGNEFATDLTSLKLMVHGSFGVVQIPENGDVLYVSAKNNKGRIKGKIAVQKSNFSFSEKQINFNDDGDYALLLTEKPGSAVTNLSSIEVGQQAKNKFGLVSLNGKDLDFSLLGFKAKANNDDSFLEDDNLVLSTRITVENIAKMVPSKLDVSLGNLTVKRNGFETLAGNKAIHFDLEKWKFTLNKWQIQPNNSGIMIQSGSLNTGLVNVGINNAVLKPNAFEISEVDVDNLTFSEVVPLNVLGKPIFGYNQSVGEDQGSHWELRIVGDYGKPGVSISALPGMKAGESMDFQSFSMISNGEQSILPGSSGEQSVTFYDVMKVRPVSFTGGDKYFEVYAGIDLGIPQVSEVYGTIRFAKPSKDITLKLYPLNFSIEGAGDVRFVPTLTGNTQTLEQGRFTAKGTLKEEKEGLVLKTELIKTPQAVWVEVNPKNQKFKLGTGYFADIDGKMESDLATESWKNFVFSGAMQGFKGLEEDARKTFTVTGSINADNQQMDVKNIPSPFGGISINYDLQNNRFTGYLDIDQSLSGIGVKAVAELLVDPGGWYFLAGGHANIPVIGKIDAGILFGDYNRMGGKVTDKVMQFAYDKAIPPSFRQGVSGFFITGRKNIPLEVPDINIDLGVINFGVGAEAGLDARLWMDFGKSGNEYGIGMMAFIHAFAKGGVDTGIASGGVKGDVRVEQGMKGIYQTQTGAFSLHGCGSVSFGVSYYACIRYPCVKLPPWCKSCGTETHTVSAKVDMNIDSEGNRDFKFNKGNCSGQPQMTGGW